MSEATSDKARRGVPAAAAPAPSNILYYGDNLDVLQRHVKDESVDLVYLDPPFNSDVDYNVLFADHGEKSAAQIRAFEDTWHWTTESRLAYEEIVESGGALADAMRAFRTMLGSSDMMAYLSMMAPRLRDLHRVLKPTGSLWLHCDPTASHYLKLLLDALFDPRHFRNEVVWRRSGSHNSSKRMGPIHDVLLYYTKSDTYFFQKSYRPYAQGHVDGYFKRSDERGRYWTNALTGAGTRKGESGQPWRGYDPTAVGRHWGIPGRIVEELGLDPKLGTLAKLDALDAAGFVAHPRKGSRAMPTYLQYLDDSLGQPLQDIWTYQPYTRGVLYNSAEAIDEDVRWLRTQGDEERLGYPTQKPRGLLTRIIRSCCPPDGLVLDPFCGCGTTIEAAQDLNRRWIGIDITHLSIGLIKHRLTGRYGPDIAKTYRVVGEPTTVEGAAVLARDDPFQFQAWALGLVGARVATSDRKGGDKGIDGRLFFHEGDGVTHQIVLSVKAGKLVPNYVRDLRGVIEREKADIGVLLSFEEPTSGMRAEALEAGFYESPWGKHPRIQLLTIGQMVEGGGIDYPHMTGSNVTLRRAKRAKSAAPETLVLFRQAATEAGADVSPPVEDE